MARIAGDARRGCLEDENALVQPALQTPPPQEKFTFCWVISHRRGRFRGSGSKPLLSCFRLLFPSSGRADQRDPSAQAGVLSVCICNAQLSWVLMASAKVQTAPDLAVCWDHRDLPVLIPYLYRVFAVELQREKQRGGVVGAVCEVGRLCWNSICVKQTKTIIWHGNTDEGGGPLQIHLRSSTCSGGSASCSPEESQTLMRAAVSACFSF